MIQIYILLPVHNRKAVTERFIDCLRAQTYQHFQLILIDDGCTDGTAAMVTKVLPRSVVLNGDGSLWWAGALQMGFSWLRDRSLMGDEVVLIINDDTVVQPDFLNIGLKLLAGPGKVMVHAQCRDEENNELLDDGVHVDWRRLTFDQVHESAQVNCLSTRGLFMRAGDFIQTGGFRPRMLPHYHSDYEFTIRAIKQGITPVIDERLVLWTLRKREPPSMVGGIRDRMRHFFSKRNHSDPLTWISFVLLACPARYLALNIFRVSSRSLVRLVRLTFS